METTTDVDLGVENSLPTQMRNYSARLMLLRQEYDHLGHVLRLSDILHRSTILQMCLSTFLCRFNQRRPPKMPHCARKNNLGTCGIVHAIDTHLHICPPLAVSDVGHFVPMTFSACKVVKTRATQCCWIHVLPNRLQFFLCLAHRTLDLGLTQSSHD